MNLIVVNIKNINGQFGNKSTWKYLDVNQFNHLRTIYEDEIKEIQYYNKKIDNIIKNDFEYYERKKKRIDQEYERLTKNYYR